MGHPTIVIEFFEGNLEALYSNTEIFFVIVDRTEDECETTVSGPYAPTLETSKLATVIDGVTIPAARLSTPGKQPFFAPIDVETLELPAIEADEDEEEARPTPYF